MRRLFFIVVLLIVIIYLFGKYIPMVFLDTGGRSLTTGEAEILHEVFGTSIPDTYNIKIFHENFIPFQSFPITVDNWIFYPSSARDKYSDDFSLAPIESQGVFVHELAHVWQHQRGVDVFSRGFLLHALRIISANRYNPYKLPKVLDTEKQLSDYNIEQQGNIVGHYFYALRGHAIDTDDTPLETYKKILPFPKRALKVVISNCGQSDFIACFGSGRTFIAKNEHGEFYSLISSDASIRFGVMRPEDKGAMFTN